MTCENQVAYYIPSGYTHREIGVRCGTTDPFGDRALCESCTNDRVKRAEHDRIMEDSHADNEALRSAGWGEI